MISDRTGFLFLLVLRIGFNCGIPWLGLLYNYLADITNKLCFKTTVKDNGDVNLRG